MDIQELETKLVEVGYKFDLNDSNKTMRVTFPPLPHERAKEFNSLFMLVVRNYYRSGYTWTNF